MTTDEREPTEKPICEVGDIVQITNRNHPWFPCVLLVSEVKAWGVRAAVLAPATNMPNEPGGPMQYWNRLRWVDFTVVGRAQYMPG